MQSLTALRQRAGERHHLWLSSVYNYGMFDLQLHPETSLTWSQMQHRPNPHKDAVVNGEDLYLLHICFSKCVYLYGFLPSSGCSAAFCPLEPGFTPQVLLQIPSFDSPPWRSKVIQLYDTGDAVSC